MRPGRTTAPVVLAISVAFWSVACDSASDRKEMLKRLESIQAEVTKLKADLSQARLDIVNRAPSHLYELFDVRRDQVVGYLRTAGAVAQNDRIFFGNDMWDVKYVKVFCASTSDDCTVPPPPGGYEALAPSGRKPTLPCYRVDRAQLLVAFGGKAMSPKSGPSQ